MITRSRSPVTPTVLLPMLTAFAVAQATTSLAEPTGGAGRVEEVLVIGQSVGSVRLHETQAAGSRLGLTSLQTPASIDIITRDDIVGKGDYSALQTVTRAAGFSASASPGNGGSSVSARGFNGHGTTVNTYDGTRLYITAGTVTFPADTWTLERVEVLRGAGAVINGVGALGATINYIPKLPVFGDPSFEAQLSTGSFDTTRLAAGGSMQLSERVAARLDASRHDTGGHVRGAGEEREVLAGSILFRANDKLSLRLSVDYADIDAAPYWGTPLIEGAANRAQRRNNYNFSDGSVEYRDLWTRARTEWQLRPGVTVRNDSYYIDAWREWQNVENYAFNPDSGLIDRSSFLGIVHDQQQLGSRSDILIETRIAGMASRFSVGAEVNVMDLDYSNNFRTGGFDFADSVPVSDFDPGRVPRSEAPTILDFTTDSTQSAAFIDSFLEATDTLALVAGLRYDDFDFDRLNHAIDDPRAASREASTFDAGFSRFTWRAGLVYQPAESLSFYAQTSTAADPVTSPVSINASNSDFDLSTGRQYEFGLKQQFLDGRAEYTLAYFDIVKKRLVTRLPGEAFSRQIGQQSSDGWELTLRIAPLDLFSVEFNAALIDARFDEFFSGSESLAGNTPRNVPEKTANLWLQWQPVAAFRGGVGLRYVDQRFANDANTQRLPAYTVLDATATWQVADNLAINLRARNLGDESDYVQAQYGTNQWIFGEPRSWEIGIRYAL